MEKSQRRLGKTKNRGNRHSNRMSANADRSQLMDSVEIKEEPDIKVEPQPMSGLQTRSVRSLDNRGDNEELAQHMIDDDEDEHVDCPFDDDDVKVEVKNECDENEKKEPESSVADEDESNGQQVEHPLNDDANNPAINQKGNGARNAKNPIKAKAKGSALKPHQCTQCEYATKYKSNLKKHLLKHTGQKPFECKHCKKAFTRKQYLQNHMKVHVKDFLFNCSVCLRGFDRRNEKVEHEDNCKALRYECHLCKTSFGSMKNNLIVHMRVHSGERAFECKECSKQFTQKSHLKRHMKLHAGPRPFRCSKCLQLFAQQNERNEHEQKCNRRTFECYACSKAFGSNKANLEKHVRTHTGDKPFACNKCLKKFAIKNSLDQHMKNHSRSLPWKCVICRQGFSKPTQWKTHQRSCRRRRYECHLCKKFFGSHLLNLKKHMTKHSGEKPFKCQICQNRFTQKQNLRRHINSIHNKKR